MRIHLALATLLVLLMSSTHAIAGISDKVDPVLSNVEGTWANLEKVGVSTFPQLAGITQRAETDSHFKIPLCRFQYTGNTEHRYHEIRLEKSKDLANTGPMFTIYHSQDGIHFEPAPGLGVTARALAIDGEKRVFLTLYSWERNENFVREVGSWLERDIRHVMEVLPSGGCQPVKSFAIVSEVYVLTYGGASYLTHKVARPITKLEAIPTSL